MEYHANSTTDGSKRTLIAGLGKTGLSCARFLARSGIGFAVADTRVDPPGLKELCCEIPRVELHLGDFDPELFVRAAEVIVSPGIPLDIPALVAARRAGVPIRGDIELFASAVDAPVVAITGSNGKSTVTTLVGEMARRAGLDVRVGGNLGTPALDLLAGGKPNLYVLELSSFQLEVTSSLRCVAATVLNISDDHLDRHHTLLEYAGVKQRVFRGNGVMVLNAEDPLVSAMAESHRTIVRFSLGIPRAETDYGIIVQNGEAWIARGSFAIMRVREVRVAGKHNLANTLAALALGEAVGIPLPAMIETVRDFPGLPHRCQYVREIGGVAYYNDSKGTNVGSTLAALAGMPGAKVVLIAGGEGKDQDFAPLKAAVAARARAVILIGRDAGILEKVLEGVTPVAHAVDMIAAVGEAHRLAQRGDCVLLSPACASFDMFKNYVHRGEVFMAAVMELPE